MSIHFPFEREAMSQESKEASHEPSVTSSASASVMKNASQKLNLSPTDSKKFTSLAQREVMSQESKEASHESSVTSSASASVMQNASQKLNLSTTDSKRFTSLVQNLEKSIQEATSDKDPQRADKATKLQTEFKATFEEISNRQVSKNIFMQGIASLLTKVLSGIGCYKACYDVTSFLCNTLSFDERKALAEYCFKQANEQGRTTIGMEFYNLGCLVAPSELGKMDFDSMACMDKFKELFESDLDEGREKFNKFSDDLTDDFFEEHIRDTQHEEDKKPIDFGQLLPFEIDAFRTAGGTTIEIEGQGEVVLDASDKDKSKRELLKAISDGFGDKRVDVLKNFLFAYNGQRVGQCMQESIGQIAFNQKGLRGVAMWDHSVTDKITVKQDGSISYCVEGKRLYGFPCDDFTDTFSQHKADASFVIVIDFDAQGGWRLNHDQSHIDCTIFHDRVPIMGADYDRIRLG